MSRKYFLYFINILPYNGQNINFIYYIFFQLFYIWCYLIWCIDTFIITKNNNIKFLQVFFNLISSKYLVIDEL